MAVYPGRQVLIKIDTNGVGGAGASWVTIGQQRDGALERSSETADATHKGDDGYPAAVITSIPWSVSCEGALPPGDSALTYLVTQWAAKAKVWIQVDESAISGEEKEGQAIITAFRKQYPIKDLISYSLDLQGDGELVTSP